MEPLFPREKLKGAMGHLKTKGLFWEFRLHTTSQDDPLFTLKDEDYKGCISMYRVYMECDTEYEASQILLGSWKHWKQLCNCSWFATEKATWDEERKTREEALAKKVILEKTAEGNVPAARTLLDENKKRRGRPSKQEKNKLARESLEQDEFLKSALKIVK